MSVLLHFPPPPREITPNGRASWQKKMRLAKEYKQACAQEILAQLGAPGLRNSLTPPVRVHVSFIYTVDRNRDEDNALASIKQLFDALVEGKVLVGDHSEVLHQSQPLFIKGLKREVLVSLDETIPLGGGA